MNQSWVFRYLREYPNETDNKITNKAFDILAMELLKPSANPYQNFKEILTICLKIKTKNEILGKLLIFISAEQLNEAYDFLISIEESEDAKVINTTWSLLGLVLFVYIRLGQFNRLLKLLR